MSHAAAARAGAQADGARLTVHHGFGTRTASMRDGIAYANDHSLLYPVGKYVALYDTQSQFQSFVYEQPAAVHEVTAMAVSPNGKYLAVCEFYSAYGASKPSRSQLTIVFLPTRRSMRTLHHTSVEGAITCATFSHDSKFVACQLGAPEHACTVWHWEKAKIVGTSKSRTPVSRVRFNPEQPAILSLSPPMRIARLGDKGNFKEVEIPSMRKLGGSAVQEHVWLSGSRLVVLTADGLAHIFVSGEHHHALRWYHPPRPPVALDEGAGAAGGGGAAEGKDEDEELTSEPSVSARDDASSAGAPAEPTAALAQPSDVSQAHTVIAQAVVARAPSSAAASSSAAHARAAPPPCSVTCVCASVQGVLIGTSDGSTLVLVDEPTGSRLRFACAIRSDARSAAVVGIALSPSESECLLQFDDCQLGTLSLRAALRTLGLEGGTAAAGGASATATRAAGGRGAGAGGADGALDAPLRAPAEFAYELLFGSVPRGAINGLAAAVSKPIFATCCDDGSVRVHSYLAPRVTLIVHAAEEGAALSLALHPLGTQLALVRKDRVSLLEVGVDALWPSRELHVAHASCAAYSNGGGQLAMACGSVVLVYSVLSGALVAKLHGHMGAVNAIYWAPDDLTLASAGSDGMAYCWGLADGSRVEEHHVKGTSYSSVALVGAVRFGASAAGAAAAADDGDARARRKWPADARAHDGSGGALDLEPRARVSRGIVDPRARPALVAVGTDHRLRLVCAGEVTELVVAQTALTDAPSVDGDAPPAPVAGAPGGTVKYTCLAAMRAQPVVFAGTADGAIHVFGVEARERDGAGGVAPRAGRDARPERRADGGAPAVGSGHGGNARLSATLTVVSSGGARAGGLVAVLVPGPVGARAWQAHHGRVTRMAVTSDDSFLMSAGEDGSVFVFSLTLLACGLECSAQPVPLASLLLSDVVSIGRRSLEELRTQLAEAVLAASETGINMETAVARVESAWRERLELKESAHTAATSRLERQLGEAHAARLGEASAFAKRLSAQAQHADNQRRETASHLEGALKLEIEKATTLAAELEAERAASASRLATLLEQLSAERAAADAAAEAHAAELRRVQQAASQQLEVANVVADEASAMSEEEHDNEVARLRREAADEHRALQAEVSQLRVDRLVDRNQMAKRAAKVEALEEAAVQKAAALGAAKAKIEALERQLGAMHVAVEERERGLGERDRAYHELSETAVKLVNCRDMLDSRVKELEVCASARARTHAPCRAPRRAARRYQRIVRRATRPRATPAPLRQASARPSSSGASWPARPTQCSPSSRTRRSDASSPRRRSPRGSTRTTLRPRSCASRAVARPHSSIASLCSPMGLAAS